MNKKTRTVIWGIVIVLFLFIIAMLIFLICENNKVRNSTDQVALQVKQTEIVRELPSIPDYAGWIYIPSTKINYPVFQGGDNEIYLKHTHDGKYCFYGELFKDYRDDELTYNTVIYGHNMTDMTMFGELDDLYKTQTEAEKHKDLTYDNKSYVLVGAFYGQEYDDYAIPMESKTERIRYSEEIKKRFVYQLSDISSEDKLLLLSTCAYLKKYQRFVVVFKIS